jgi:hypothetical protein
VVMQIMAIKERAKVVRRVSSYLVIQLFSSQSVSAKPGAIGLSFGAARLLLI